MSGTWYDKLMTGGYGVLGGVGRAGLGAASAVYARAVSRRNRRYDGREPQRVDALVISVGNITTGGTGKTPLVLEIVRRLREMGCKTAVVSRGYRAAGGVADELALVEHRFPDVVCVANADRVLAAQTAVNAGANVVVLDDGFQHRRLGRTLDLVVVDATRPFGHGHVLPRGLLREPLSGLSRADAFVVTRCELVDSAVVERVEEVIRRHAADKPILRCRSRSANVAGLRPGMDVRGREVHVFAGIGNPGSFEKLVQSTGRDVCGATWFRDHHAYTLSDMAALGRAARGSGAGLLLTTEKDAVKLGGLEDAADMAIGVVRLEIDFEPSCSRMLETLLRGAVQRSSDLQEPVSQ